MSRRLSAGLLLTGLACASPPREPAAPDVSVVRPQIDTLWATYSAAAVAGDVDAIARLYADDAYLVESGMPTVRGSTELRALVKNVLGGVRILESDIRPELTDVAGDRVLQFGTYRDVIQATGQPVQRVHGRFAAVLQRDSTAAWRVTRLIAVVDSTLPQPPAPK